MQGWSRKMQPLRNPVPLLQRLAAAFATRTSTQAAVPRTRQMGTSRHHDQPAQLAPQAHWGSLTRILFLLKSSRRAFPRNGSRASPAAPGFDPGPIPPRARRVASRNHNLAPARPSPRRGPIFQSITRFGMTGRVGDPATGSPDLPSPPVDGPQPLVQPGRPLRGRPLCSGHRFCPVETSCPRERGGRDGRVFGSGAGRNRADAGAQLTGCRVSYGASSTSRRAPRVSW